MREGRASEAVGDQGPELRKEVPVGLVMVVVEGERYLVSMLGQEVWRLLVLRVLELGSEGAEETSGVRHGYWEGVKRSARIYVLLATTLIVAAIYEAGAPPKRSFLEYARSLRGVAFRPIGVFAEAPIENDRR